MSDTDFASSDRNTRLEHLAAVRSVVIKLGTQLLTGPGGQLDGAFLSDIARQIQLIRGRQIAVTVVSSGAIGAGLRELKLDKRPSDLARLQAVAAVGQRRLMDVWAAAFEPLGLPVAQLLLTREDVDSRPRFLNVRNTIHAAHELGAVPIINENDTISTDEIVQLSFGDNDILAAHVAAALRADLLVLLTVVDGILDAAGTPVRQVSNITEAQQLVRTDKSPLGRGGMSSKLAAAKTMMDAGEAMIVADGRTPDLLPRLLDGQPLGTLFTPSSPRRTGRSRWIHVARAAGAVVLDDGAVRAIVEMNRSLLPAGIVKVEGTFDRGDIIALRAPDGREIARGLTNYAAADIDRIRGKRTQEVRTLLAEAAYDEVVHRDNLVVG